MDVWLGADLQPNFTQTITMGEGYINTSV